MKGDKDKMQTYEEVIQHLISVNRTPNLLLGNGFSMAYDSGIFSYNALSKFIDHIDDDILKKLFNIIKTNNFELIMQQLDNLSAIAKVFDLDKATIYKIDEASTTLKNSLIEAVKSLHPDHVFTIPEDKSNACANFLNYYIFNEGNIFSTNYDLLLYWVLMRNEIENSIDGFGRDREETDGYVPEEDLVYSELKWGNNKEINHIHYLH